MALFCGFSWFENNKYERFSKKDDNYGLNEIEAWKNRNPILTSQPTTLDKINIYVQKVLKDLQVTVTSTNCHLVEQHLITLARQSDFIQTAFFNNIKLIKCENQNISKSIASKII